MTELLVLCYHAVSPTWPAALSVKPDAFERQVSALVREGWVSATFTEVVKMAPTRRTLVLTFDDAFASVKTYALPILGDLGVKATVFSPTQYVSTQAKLAWPGLTHWEHTSYARELAPMTWDDLGELAELGWEIGSHSQTHPMLTSLDDEALARELRGSREECAQRLGRPVTSIAYPYGEVDDRVAASARAAGYEAGAALTWPSAQLNPYQYPRIGVYHKDSWPRFRFKVGRWSRSPYGSKLIARRAAGLGASDLER
jgi:peptidoglycan/xylan/chitin deacetylase (PgdA/CDA1 family)